MGTLVKGLFRNRWHPQLHFVRNKSKIHVTKPRLPHYDRALMEHVSLPFFSFERKPKHLPDFESCKIRVAKPDPYEDHPFRIILANESLEFFKNSRMVAFFHINSFNSEEKFQCQVLLKKGGMKLRFINKDILKKALTGTIYETVLIFYKAPTALAFCPEPNIHKLLDISKKLPKLVLMGGLVDDRLLSLTELLAFGKFCNLEEARLSLLATINSASLNLVRQMSHHPSTLVQYLKQHKEILEKQ